jgi:hypothetical protein
MYGGASDNRRQETSMHRCSSPGASHRALAPCRIPSLAALTFIALLMALPASASEAMTADAPQQQASASAPYITQHGPDGGIRAVVMGDSMADGLYSGIYRVLKDDTRLTFIKKTKVNTGIVRNDRYDWNEAALEIAAEKAYDVAIVVFGANELQSIREDGKAYHFSQPGWELRFSQRIDDIIDALKSENIATYWVGLPITRKDRYQEEYAYVNGFFRDAAARNGIRYVDTWSEFADANGEFTPFGTSLSGEEIQLRSDDGVHFTTEGYEKYASVVAAVLEKDVNDVLPPIATAPCAADKMVCENSTGVAPGQ